MNVDLQAFLASHLTPLGIALLLVLVAGIAVLGHNETVRRRQQ
jgi:uncharacterized integral membrane protein